MTKSIEVVIVDDEIHLTEIIKTFVECSSTNAKIHTFNDASKARSFLLGNDVDILITDYKMCNFNGIELMESVSPDVKKVLVSGYVSEIVQERLKQLDAVFFEKPVSMSELGMIITNHEKKVGRFKNTCDKQSV